MWFASLPPGNDRPALRVEIDLKCRVDDPVREGVLARVAGSSGAKIVLNSMSASSIDTLDGE